MRRTNKSLSIKVGNNYEYYVRLAYIEGGFGCFLWFIGINVMALTSKGNRH